MIGPIDGPLERFTIYAFSIDIGFKHGGQSKPRLSPAGIEILKYPVRAFI